MLSESEIEEKKLLIQIYIFIATVIIAGITLTSTLSSFNHTTTSQNIVITNNFSYLPLNQSSLIPNNLSSSTQLSSDIFIKEVISKVNLIFPLFLIIILFYYAFLTDKSQLGKKIRTNLFLINSFAIINSIFFSFIICNYIFLQMASSYNIFNPLLYSIYYNVLILINILISTIRLPQIIQQTKIKLIPRINKDIFKFNYNFLTGIEVATGFIIGIIIGYALYVFICIFGLFKIMMSIILFTISLISINEQTNEDEKRRTLFTIFKSKQNLLAQSQPVDLHQSNFQNIIKVYNKVDYILTHILCPLIISLFIVYIYIVGSFP